MATNFFQAASVGWFGRGAGRLGRRRETVRGAKEDCSVRRRARIGEARREEIMWASNRRKSVSSRARLSGLRPRRACSIRWSVGPYPSHHHFARQPPSCPAPATPSPRPKCDSHQMDRPSSPPRRPLSCFACPRCRATPPQALARPVRPSPPRQCTGRAGSSSTGGQHTWL